MPLTLILFKRRKRERKSKARGDSSPTKGFSRRQRRTVKEKARKRLTIVYTWQKKNILHFLVPESRELGLMKSRRKPSSLKPEDRPHLFVYGRWKRRRTKVGSYAWKERSRSRESRESEEDVSEC